MIPLCPVRTEKPTTLPATPMPMGTIKPTTEPMPHATPHQTKTTQPHATTITETNQPKNR